MEPYTPYGDRDGYDDLEEPTDDESAKDLAPFSNPPTGHAILTTKYNSLDNLIFVIYEFAATVYFTIVKSRSTNYIPGFGYLKINIVYQKGKIRPSEAYLKQTSTLKRDYP